jgi:hypothetical protein
MKKIILTALMQWIVMAALGQAGVNFRNDSFFLSSPPDRLIRFGQGTGELAGTPAFGTNYQVQLYYGASTASEGSLISVTNAPARLRSETTSLPGTWFLGGFRYLLGFDSQSGTVNLQVRVWDIDWGLTYEAALANPSYDGLYGKSEVFQYLIPLTFTAPPDDFLMANFAGFDIDVIPEPSSFALLALGAAILLRRRYRSANSGL